MPVDSIATVAMPHWISQWTSACKSLVKVPKHRTGSSSRSSGTEAQISSSPISMPAALGRICFKTSRLTAFRRFRFFFFMANLLLLNQLKIRYQIFQTRLPWVERKLPNGVIINNATTDKTTGNRNHTRKRV